MQIAKQISKISCDILTQFEIKSNIMINNFIVIKVILKYVLVCEKLTIFNMKLMLYKSTTKASNNSASHVTN